MRFENGYGERDVRAGELGPGYFGVEGDFRFPEVGGVGLDEGGLFNIILYNITQQGLSTKEKEGVVLRRRRRRRRDDGMEWNGMGGEGEGREAKGGWGNNGTYFEFRPIIVILLLIPLWQNSSDLGFRSLHGYARCLHNNSLTHFAQTQATTHTIYNSFKSKHKQKQQTHEKAVERGDPSFPSLVQRRSLTTVVPFNNN